MSDLLDAEAQEATQSRVVSSRALGHSSLSLSLATARMCSRVCPNGPFESDASRRRCERTRSINPSAATRPPTTTSSGKAASLIFVLFFFPKKNTERCGLCDARDGRPMPRECAFYEALVSPSRGEGFFFIFLGLSSRSQDTGKPVSRKKRCVYLCEFLGDARPIAVSPPRVERFSFFYSPEKKRNDFSLSRSLSLSLSLFPSRFSCARASQLLPEVCADGASAALFPPPQH